MSKKTKKYAGAFLSPMPDVVGTKNLSDQVKYEKEQEKAQEAKLNASLKASLASITKQSDVDTAAIEAAKREEEKMKKRKGYKSTILTSSSGIVSPAPTKKTELG